MMLIRWFVGKDGPFEAGENFKRFISFDDLYVQVPHIYRYALGYSDDGEFLCWDTYQSGLTKNPPFDVRPHFIETFEDMDHALAALTIKYERDYDAEYRTAENRADIRTFKTRKRDASE